MKTYSRQRTLTSRMIRKSNSNRYGRGPSDTSLAGQVMNGNLREMLSSTEMAMIVARSMARKKDG